MEPFQIKFKALTPIWTGGADGKGDKWLHSTGIIGSLRWWYEAIVRGLDGYACDPSETNRCEYKQNQQSICPVCHLFGCTGWQRKFRLEIRSNNDGKPGPVKKEAIKANDKAWLCFIQLQPMNSFEKALLYAALSISSRYGSIGGKTILKPSEKPGENGRGPHQDFGLFEVELGIKEEKFPREIITNYLNDFSKKKNDPFWPDIRYFWFAPEKSINRLEINKIIGRMANGDDKRNVAKWQEWLRGDQGDSKKLFSFLDGKRSWGYLIERYYAEAKPEIEKIDSKILWGGDLINELFNKALL